MTSGQELARFVVDARARTLELVADLTDEQLMGPRLAIVNPLLWEIGHVAWFQERWFLRHVHGRAPLLAGADELYDSIAIAHDLRWDLPLPSRARTLEYLMAVRDATLACVERGELGPDDGYFVELGVLHEDMHDEAFVYTRQTLGYPAPPFVAPDSTTDQAAISGDAEVPGGPFPLGALPGTGFVFDNEKWAHAQELRPFRIARAAVTEAELAEFVDAGGYRHDEFWSEAARAWRARARAEHPVHWRRNGKSWLVREFDQWRPLAPNRAATFVCAYEAEAYCRWAGRRLPTELEWEAAAAGEPDATGSRLGSTKRQFAWGDRPPTTELANLDLARRGSVDVGACAAGDSAFGCRQLIGNVWEWTATPFEPYPGFVADPYREYSEPWFRTHRVLRGGCFATRARLIRNTWRNFYTPDRRDVIAGFRTCALD